MTALYEVKEESCISSPDRPPSEKQYTSSELGFVLSGWFDYRCETGSVTAVTGAVLFGNAGAEFSCRHNDTLGNRRLVVSFDGGFLQNVANDCELNDTRFHLAALPPGKRSAANPGACLRATRSVFNRSYGTSKNRSNSPVLSASWQTLFN